PCWPTQTRLAPGESRTNLPSRSLPRRNSAAWPITTSLDRAECAYHRCDKKPTFIDTSLRRLSQFDRASRRGLHRVANRLAEPTFAKNPQTGQRCSAWTRHAISQYGRRFAGLQNHLGRAGNCPRGQFTG